MKTKTALESELSATMSWFQYHCKRLSHPEKFYLQLISKMFYLRGWIDES